MGVWCCYIDGRSPGSRLTTPEQISKALRNEVMSEDFQRAIKKAFSSVSAKAEMKISPVTNLSLQVPVNFKGSEEDLEETLVGLEKLFAASKWLPKKPVVVIDEANELMDWSESKPSNPQLKSLFNFLILISKQLNLVHVIFATSDYFLVGWLTGKGLTEDKFGRKVLGDLPEKLARDFVFGDAEETWSGIVNNPQCKSLPVPAGSEEQWPAIYERCGGNIWLLRLCVKNARGETNWDDALDSVVEGAVSAARNAAKPGGLPMLDIPPLWNGAQWKKVLELITKAPYHAVSKSELEEELEKSSKIGGELILRSMVKYNLLALRYPSDLARDLPQEVYGKSRTTVVTLLLPSYVLAAKQMLQDEDFLKACEPPKNTAAADDNPTPLL